MQVNITLFWDKRQGAFIRAGTFIQTHTVPFNMILGYCNQDLLEIPETHVLATLISDYKKDLLPIICFDQFISEKLRFLEVWFA